MRRLWDLVPAGRRRFVRFALVGASGVAVNLGVMAGARALLAGAPSLGDETRDFIASALGIIISILTNFLLNDAWTWGDRDKGTRRRDFWIRIGTYFVGAGLAAGVQFGTFALLYSAWGLSAYPAQLVGIGLGTIVNYIINNRVVFRNQPAAAPDHHSAAGRGSA